MRNILLITLMAFLSQNLIFAQAADDRIKARLNVIHINEVNFKNGSDTGIGVTAEVGFIFNETDGVFQSIGLEVGHIVSNRGSFDLELIPIFVNYTIGGDIGESGFIWEAGAGLGGLSLDVENSSDSEDDFVIGGQFFGGLGYEFNETFSVLAGMRYMTSGESDAAESESFDGEKQEILNSMAIDLSLNFTF